MVSVDTHDKVKPAGIQIGVLVRFLEKFWSEFLRDSRQKILITLEEFHCHLQYLDHELKVRLNQKQIGAP